MTPAVTPVGQLAWTVRAPASARPAAAVAVYAEADDIPVVRFGKDDRKAEVMTSYLRRQAATGCSGVAAIGVAQEFQRVWAAYERQPSTGSPQWSFTKTDRRVTCCYFYLWDVDFGPAFIKVCSYFPYPAKVWINGHEWVKRQGARAGIGYRELSNGFASADDPAALQEVCDRLGPGTINVFVQRWLARLPLPLTEADQAAGYWWECSMRQIEASRTIVFDAPRHARAFFEALIVDNLDVGRRIEHTNRYLLTPDGIRVAIFYTKIHNRLLRPLLAADQPQAPPELRAALNTIHQHVEAYLDRARLPGAE